jgi:hypothetical protein
MREFVSSSEELELLGLYRSVWNRKNVSVFGKAGLVNLATFFPLQHETVQERRFQGREKCDSSGNTRSKAAHTQSKQCL